MKNPINRISGAKRGFGPRTDRPGLKDGKNLLRRGNTECPVREPRHELVRATGKESEAADRNKVKEATGFRLLLPGRRADVGQKLRVLFLHLVQSMSPPRPSQRTADWRKHRTQKADGGVKLTHPAENLKEM